MTEQSDKIMSQKQNPDSSTSITNRFKINGPQNIREIRD